MTLLSLFNRPETTKTWTVDAMLDDAAMQAAFHHFCAQRFTEETLEFLTETQGGFRKDLSRIVETYIQRSRDAFGGKTLTLPAAMRDGILNAYAVYQRGSLGDFLGELTLEKAIDEARVYAKGQLAELWDAFMRTDAFAVRAGLRGTSTGGLGLGQAGWDLAGRPAAA